MIHAGEPKQNNSNLSKPLKIVLIITGSISVFLGLLGVLLPLLPTTPFLLLAVACYSKSSERLHNKLLSNKVLGNVIRNYREGRGISLHTKVTAITLLWISIGYSVLFLITINSVRALLLLLLIVKTIYLLRN